MTGRQEHNNKIEAKIRGMIQNAPEFIIKYSYNFDDKTETTKKAYLRYVMDFCKFFDNKVFNLAKSDINRYMDSIRLNAEGRENSVSIRKARLAAIKDFFNFLVEDGYTLNNPSLTVKPPREYNEKEVVAMTVSEMHKVLDNIRNGMGSQYAKARQKDWLNRDLAIVMLGCSTGLRCSAITEIDIDDVDFEKSTIKVVEKGNKIREINVGKTTMDIINQWIKDRKGLEDGTTNALFISNRRQRISQKSVENLLGKYTANLNKHITPHKMRSSCATNLYEQTGDIYLVQEVLGHKNIANTRRYAKMSEDKKRQAAEIMDGLL